MFIKLNCFFWFSQIAKKMYNIVIHLFFLNLFFTQIIKSHKYGVKKNVNVTTNPIWLLNSYKMRNKMNCLSKCNLNEDCLSSTFSNDYLLENNCHLYRMYFDPSEISETALSNLYTKDCKCSIRNNFFYIHKFNLIFFLKVV